jgi:hypothetical protein
MAAAPRLLRPELLLASSRRRLPRAERLISHLVRRRRLEMEGAA